MASCKMSTRGSSLYHHGISIENHLAEIGAFHLDIITCKHTEPNTSSPTCSHVSWGSCSPVLEGGGWVVGVLRGVTAVQWGATTRQGFMKPDLVVVRWFRPQTHTQAHTHRQTDSGGLCLCCLLFFFGFFSVSSLATVFSWTSYLTVILMNVMWCTNSGLVRRRHPNFLFWQDSDIAGDHVLWLVLLFLCTAIKTSIRYWHYNITETSKYKIFYYSTSNLSF